MSWTPLTDAAAYIGDVAETETDQAFAVRARALAAALQAAQEQHAAIRAVADYLTDCIANRDHEDWWQFDASEGYEVAGILIALALAGADPENAPETPQERAQRDFGTDPE